MYTKKLAESRALRIVTRMVVLFIVTVIAFAAFGSVAGLAVLGAGLVIGLLLELRPNTRELHELANAAAEGGPHDGRHVLVVANAPLAGEELAAELTGHGVIDVLAPPLPSTVHLAVSDVDRELAAAQVRLDRSLAWARAHGLEARGEIGDPSTFTGMADELRGFGADEVIVVAETGDERVSRHELERLAADLAVPVHAVSV